MHLILELPISFSSQQRNVKVEVQIRTIAMDFWTSLEHQLKYKRPALAERELIDRLKTCADVIVATDEEMLQIRSQIDKAAPDTESELLLKKLQKMDRPL